MRTRKDRTLADADQYGFRWGQLDVTRLAELPDGSRALGVSTDFGAIEIYVSKTGRSIRAFKGSEEMKSTANPKGTP